MVVAAEWTDRGDSPLNRPLIVVVVVVVVAVVRQWCVVVVCGADRVLCGELWQPPKVNEHDLYMCADLEWWEVRSLVWGINK